MTEVWQGLWANACHFAIIRSQIELARVLIDHSCTDIDATLHATSAATSIFEQTSLLDLAVLQGLSSIVDRLLAKGARLRSNSRVAALHVCSAKGDLESGVKLLMAGADIDINGKHGTCLYQAQHEGQWKMVTLLRLFGATTIPTVAAAISDEEQAFFDKCLQLNQEPSANRHSINVLPQEAEDARGRSAARTPHSVRKSRSQPDGCPFPCEGARCCRPGSAPPAVQNAMFLADVPDTESAWVNFDDALLPLSPWDDAGSNAEVLFQGFSWEEAFLWPVLDDENDKVMGKELEDNDTNASLYSDSESNSEDELRFTNLDATDNAILIDEDRHVFGSQVHSSSTGDSPQNGTVPAVPQILSTSSTPPGPTPQGMMTPYHDSGFWPTNGEDRKRKLNERDSDADGGKTKLQKIKADSG